MNERRDDRRRKVASRRGLSGRRRAVAAVGVAAVAFLVACGGDESQPTRVVANADPGVGEELIEGYGCGSCHTIPGIAEADGLVGPPLVEFGRRSFIAGQLANTPENLIRWLLDPEAVEPGTAMPDLGLTEAEARDIASYLEQLG